MKGDFYLTFRVGVDWPLTSQVPTQPRHETGKRTESGLPPPIWTYSFICPFLSDPGVPGVRSMGSSLSNKLREVLQTYLMWLWLMNIQAQYKLIMPIGHSMEFPRQGKAYSKEIQIWFHLEVKFATDASSATWWPNLQSVQVAPSGDQICN